MAEHRPSSVPRLPLLAAATPASRCAIFDPVVDQGGDVVLTNGVPMTADPVDADLLWFSFGSSIGGEGTWLYRYADGAVTSTHANTWHGYETLVFSPADPDLLYLDVLLEQIDGRAAAGRTGAAATPARRPASAALARWSSPYAGTKRGRASRPGGSCGQGDGGSPPATGPQRTVESAAAASSAERQARTSSTLRLSFWSTP